MYASGSFQMVLSCLDMFKCITIALMHIIPSNRYIGEQTHVLHVLRNSYMYPSMYFEYMFIQFYTSHLCLYAVITIMLEME